MEGFFGFGLWLGGVRAIIACPGTLEQVHCCLSYTGYSSVEEQSWEYLAMTNDSGQSTNVASFFLQLRQNILRRNTFRLARCQIIDATLKFVGIFGIVLAKLLFHLHAPSVRVTHDKRVTPFFILFGFGSETRTILSDQHPAGRLLQTRQSKSQRASISRVFHRPLAGYNSA